jgi:hypothetical protein
MLHCRNGFGTHVYTNGDQWDGVWVADKPHGAGLYIFYQSEHKVRSAFIKQGDPAPVHSHGQNAAELLRKEDKIRILQEGEEAAKRARSKAEVRAHACAQSNYPYSTILLVCVSMLRWHGDEPYRICVADSIIRLFFHISILCCSTRHKWQRMRAL